MIDLGFVDNENQLTTEPFTLSYAILHVMMSILLFSLCWYCIHIVSINTLHFCFQDCLHMQLEWADLWLGHAELVTETSDTAEEYQDPRLNEMVQ